MNSDFSKFRFWKSHFGNKSKCLRCDSMLNQLQWTDLKLLDAYLPGCVALQGDPYHWSFGSPSDLCPDSFSHFIWHLQKHRCSWLPYDDQFPDLYEGLDWSNPKSSPTSNTECKSQRQWLHFYCLLTQQGIEPTTHQSGINPLSCPINPTTMTDWGHPILDTEDRGALNPASRYTTSAVHKVLTVLRILFAPWSPDKHAIMARPDKGRAIRGPFTAPALFQFGRWWDWITLGTCRPLRLPSCGWGSHHSFSSFPSRQWSRCAEIPAQLILGAICCQNMLCKYKILCNDQVWRS